MALQCSYVYANKFLIVITRLMQKQLHIANPYFGPRLARILLVKMNYFACKKSSKKVCTI